MLHSLFLVLATLVSAPPAAGAGVLVVCPDSFRESLGPWVEHRRAQGHRVVILSNEGSAADIRQRIRQRAGQGNAQFLVLVGDAGLADGNAAVVGSTTIPAHEVAAKVNIRWGSEPEIATDNWYADLDDDQLPDLAVGRLTADTPAQLRTIVSKIIRYEATSSTTADVSGWRRRINFVAGLGGFGALADLALEACAKKFITEGVPAAYDTSMTYASWRSPYCPDPRRFGQTTLERLNEGCLFWVYIGHGHARGLDRMAVPGALFPILELADVAAMKCAQGSPIAIFLSCHTGAFDAPQDCLAEEMLRKEGGPVAVVSGSRVTMPYGMAVLGAEALKECFQNRRQTLGEVLLHAKRNSVLGSRSDEASRALDALAGALNTGADLAEERLEHVHLFNLLGDPLLRIPHPGEVEVQAAATAQPGDVLEVSGTCPVEGPCRVELVVRRDRLTFKASNRQHFDRTHSSLSAYREVYQRANDPRLAAVETRVVDGRFRTQLTVPPETSGHCHIRVFVQGRGDFALGASDVQVTAAARSPSGAAQ